jgi:eukaryotic-like serine/threonine-protein kinase
MFVVFEPAGLLASEGALIAGRFQVGRAVAVGAKATVFAGRHVGLDEPVAIKVLHPNLANPRFTARFIREARNATRIKSEHVPRYIDVGELENGLPFVIMEYLEGCTLRNLTSRKTEIDIGDAVDYILQASEAVAAAHAVGILHRDLKPSNLFLTTRIDGSAHIKVLDFGTSRAFNSQGEREDEGLTIAHLTPGSQKFHAPEQFGAEEPDARCDIWALGAVLYTLLTLRPPFTSHAPGETMRKILESAPEPITTVRPAIPAGLEEAVLRCLQKQRDARPASVAELAMLLEPFASKRAAGLPEQIGEIQKHAHAAVVRDQAALHIASLPESSWNTPARRSQRGLAPLPVLPAPNRTSTFLFGGIALGALIACAVIVRCASVDSGRASVAPPPMATTAATATTVATSVPAESPPAQVQAPASVASAPATVASSATSRPPPPLPRGPRVVSRTPRSQPPPPKPAPTPTADPWGWQR